MADDRPNIAARFSELIGLPLIRREALNWGSKPGERIKRLFVRFAFRWHAEAVKRVPVDKSTLKQSLTHRVEMEGQNIVAIVGTPVEYAEKVEFGTKRIAKGRVLALGRRIEITDAEAVHSWPAKEHDATERTSFEMLKDPGDAEEFGRWSLAGKAGKGWGKGHVEVGIHHGRLVNSEGTLLARRPQEQMPWLRPAFMELRPWLMQELEKIFEVNQ